LISSSATNNPIVRTYVLPDFIPTSNNKLGYVRQPKTGNTPPPTADENEMQVDGEPKPPLPAVPVEEEQLLQMGNERFTVPEVLFNPSTIG
jgi:actin-related protein 6